MIRRRVCLVALIAGLGVITSCGSSRPPQRATPTTAAATTTTQPSLPPAPSTTTPTVPPTPSPSTTITPSPAEVVTRGRSDRPLVALTFDAGSDPGQATAILDILAAGHIRASFGITGAWAQANPELVQRIAAAGDQIVNHSWNHPSFTGASTHTSPLAAAEIVEQLNRTDRLIRQLTGSGTGGWFRPPYGDRNAQVDLVAGAAHYRYDLMWTVDSLGWKGASPDTVLSRCLAAASAGEIILMHVGSASTDAAALPALIAALRARGFGFATVAELM